MATIIAIKAIKDKKPSDTKEISPAQNDAMKSQESMPLYDPQPLIGR
ncbi:MAG: hypothetical protein IT286_02775 [Proteobacteria bacterium]|nr:hypothetical protein [Pseudomonadota bacterium]